MEMKKLAIIGLPLALGVTPMSFAATNNIIINGGFEKPMISGWKANKNIPGWQAIRGDIEVQHRVAGAPHSGNQHVELDAYGSSSIAQVIATIPNQVYKLSFAFAARPGTRSGDNKLKVVWGGKIVATLDAGNNSQWKMYSYQVKASGSKTRLEFHDIGHSNGLGTYIDNVSLVKKGPSPCQSKKIAETYTRTGAGENLVAPFTSPSTSTTKSYSGLVEVIVSGTGYSYGMTVNDAFFGVKTGKPLDPQYYQLNLGWNAAPLKPYSGESRNISNFIKFVDGMGKAAVPTYNSNNRYHFVIEVPKDAGRLSFGVSDGGFDENGGQYNIEVYPVKKKSCQKPPQKDESIVACYPFNGNAMDSSGNGNHGTIRGAMIKNGVVHVGEGNSNPSYVTFGRNIDQFKTNNFTVSFWFKTLEKTRLFDLAGDRTAGSHGNYLSIRMTGKHESVPEGSVTAEIDQHGGASRIGMISARNGLNDGKWHHTVVVRKANSSTLYIDGKVENSKKAGGIANIVNNNDFRLGRSYRGFRNAVVQYDNLCIYKEALSANKVKALFVK
jgi:hypothetical protein